MKSAFILFALSLLSYVMSNKNRHRLRNRKSEMMFSTESLKAGNNDKPKFLDKIFTAKPIGVQAKYSVLGEENKPQQEAAQADLRFKENTNNLSLRNLESPTIVKSLGYQEPFDVMGRVASQSTQSISNRQAYDSLYPSHKSWYDEKKFVVLDKNFNDMENYLLNQFKDTLNKQFDFSATKNVKHVDELDKSQINLSGMDFGAMPKVHSEAVKVNSKYVNNFTAENTKVTSSDPYKEIFGNHHYGN